MNTLPKNQANYTPLTPITFLDRASAVYADRPSVVYGRTRFTWLDTHRRCHRLARALRHRLHISRNDVVSIIAPNIPAMYEVHFAVPMAGAALNAINTRLDPPTVATILRHSEAKLLLFDHQFASLVHDALSLLTRDKSHPPPPLVLIDDPQSPRAGQPGVLEYEELIESGDPRAELPPLADEWDAIALNYTSGTTSAPKGVVCSHRGAYLSAMSLVLQWGVGSEPVYLWSLPMFHCNGWGLAWGMAARGGTNVCLRSCARADIYGAIAEHGVTHMSCAPVVFNILMDGGKPWPRAARRVEVLVGGAPPAAAMLEKVEEWGFEVTHAYGMTETTGAALVCEWRKGWRGMGREERGRVKARQGAGVLSMEGVEVKEAGSGRRVARDGREVGEIAVRGSGVMKGYLKDEAGNGEAFREGWFWTGDVGVVHPDGYVEIKDRRKDVIISGGENISSVEVETVLYGHGMVEEAAVVAMPHGHWGESPCAFVKTREGGEVREEEVIGYCRRNMPGYMVPRKVVVVEEMPKTATGKIMKSRLREMARELGKGERRKSVVVNKSEEGEGGVVLAKSRL